jgi:hypothetical protein
MPALSEARRRNQSHIACAEYRNPHFEFLLTVDLQGPVAHAPAAVAFDFGWAP